MLEKNINKILEFTTHLWILAGLVAAFGLGAWHQLMLIVAIIPLWVVMHKEVYGEYIHYPSQYVTDFFLIFVYLKKRRRFNKVNPLSWLILLLFLLVGMVVGMFKLALELIKGLNSMTNTNTQKFK